MTPKKGITLDEFTIFSEKNHPNATGKLSKLLRDIGLASKIINREVRKAGLVDDIIGVAGSENIQGEAQQKLDVFADNQLIHFLAAGGQCCGLASEENNTFIAIEESKNADYIVLFDPLDGSSNIDVNVSIGTIFSIYKRLSPKGESVQEKDFLQAGKNIVAAGYVIYGSSTMFVYSTGSGVNGFTLEPSLGEYCLSHYDIRIPERGTIYSINQGYYAQFEPFIQTYIDYCNMIDIDSHRPYALRYIGSMVADFHRNLIKGGIFMYPAMKTYPMGKLRLQYECNPLSFIANQAGGIATDGKQDILAIQPVKLHQRTPILLGSTDMVRQALSYQT